jgi:hypothetical protein
MLLHQVEDAIFARVKPNMMNIDTVSEKERGKIVKERQQQLIRTLPLS